MRFENKTFLTCVSIASILMVSACQKEVTKRNHPQAVVQQLNKAAIAGGYENIRVSNDDPNRKPNPLMMEYALQYNGKRGATWQEADSASRAMMNKHFTRKDQWPEVQFVCLNMMKKYLLPSYAQHLENMALQQALRFYLDRAIQLKAEDWDVLTAALLATKPLYSAEEWAAHRNYIVAGSKSDLANYASKLDTLSLANDADQSKAYTKAYYEHIIHDAKFALAHLATAK